MSKRKRLFSILFALPPLLFGLLYGGGYIAQFMHNYNEWQSSGGTPGGGTSPTMPSFDKPKRTRQKKANAVDGETVSRPKKAATKKAGAEKKETEAAIRQDQSKTDPILTLEVDAEVTTETHEMDAAWHEIQTSYRTRRILTGMLGGVEETELGKTLAIVDYKGFRVVIPLKEMLVKLEKNLTGAEYTDMIRRQNKLLSNMLGCEIDFIVKGMDAKTRTVVASRKEAMLKKRQVLQNGLCCAAFVSYYVMNYLPNIEGADTQFISDAIHATGMNSQAVVTWQTALNKLANEGKIEKIGTSASNVDRSKLTPGDLIIFGTSSNSHTHIAVYSGTYNGVDFIIHVGNDRGPEISRVDWMGQAGDKSSYPNAYFHLPQEVFESDGDIEVYKKDTDGNKLAGAVFVATNTETGKSYKIGPTNSNGYAKTENPVPYGTYTVKETVFPTNFHAYGQTEWTVTVDANNDGLVTINAVNEADPGSAKIVKTSEDGVVEGITFTITGNGINQTVTTDVNGEVQIDDLKPGTYQVKETMVDKYEPQETRSVVVVSNQVATVTFNNVLKRGDLQVIKTSEDNLVEGVKFHLYGTSLSGLKVDEYAVTDKNGVATFHDVLISGHESYTLEEMDTAERYIVPESQRTAIEWNVVTEKSFYNELKRGDLIVKKTSEALSKV